MSGHDALPFEAISASRPAFRIGHQEVLLF